ncbi:transporter [Methylobacterium sp. J-090]|uniref:transporter n=1 Tax=Methylobacterium sp. J-090 TaxID=2836666 RepID=UPI001FB91E31|nr:transporter [Methylobacterium sp. J-090]MCJ2082749.1 transporter [Methylobacterium sp. J-090]
MVAALAGGTAQAGSAAQPGQTVGLPAGAPFAVGLYFVNTSSFGIRSTEPRGTELNINLPSFIWATPWTLAGGRLQFVVLQPIAATSSRGAPYQSGIGQTLLAGQVAWTLSEHVHVSYLLGAYVPSDTRIVIQNAVLHQRFAATYNGDGLNLTAHVLHGILLDTVSPLGTYYPDFLNLDLTATRKFGKWEVGPVAFASTDLPTTRRPGTQRQGQVAVGGLIGYDFGPVNLQAYVTRDVAQSNYGGVDTRGWLRAIVPVYKDGGAEPLRPIFSR